MKYGFILPFGDVNTAADYAETAEKNGWDGFFVWESIWGVDAWVSLAAAAILTRRIKLGTMLSPLSRMRPWKIASETTSLDRLSIGRTILSVGLGAPEVGFAAFNEVTDRKTRAELLDESLEIITGLWSGEPVKHQGKHYQVDTSLLDPAFAHPSLPIQKPRIPIWVVGAWFHQKSIDRVMKYDGFIPNFYGLDGQIQMGTPSPTQIREVAEYISTHKTEKREIDLIVEGRSSGENHKNGAENVRRYQDAGATWWLESMWGETDPQAVLLRIHQGPPK